MDTTPHGNPDNKPSGARRAAAGAGGWLRRHPLGTVQILLLILLAIIVLQNLEPTSIDVLFWTVARLPKLMIIVISMVLGALTWELIRRHLKPHARGATPTSRTRP
ncbi:hypothetical protein [Alloalcanivorax mobilis]|uniref:hypothetical protein n=1 Tax=Alloalcanivorax mobilis TaxID=2019569 RepID=UPI000C76FA0A|nr:hypothetical protein [Alloalcanivorax mobilis]